MKGIRHLVRGHLSSLLEGIHGHCVVSVPWVWDQPQAR